MQINHRATEPPYVKNFFSYRSGVYGFFTIYIDEFPTPVECFSTQFSGNSGNSTTRFEPIGATHTTDVAGCFLYL